MKNAIPLACFGVAFAALAVAVPATAEEMFTPPQDQSGASVDAASNPGIGNAGVTSSPAKAAPSTAIPTDADPFAQAVRVSDGDLDQNRGGESIVVGNQTLRAITSGNTLNGDYAAGSITLTNGALSNFNGIGNFAINTGAQVSLQSGMNLTINISQ
jgi:hypothetical protein